MSFVASTSVPRLTTTANSKSDLPRGPKHLSLSALDSWSQKSFDNNIIPSIPGFHDLRGNSKRKSTNHYLQTVLTMTIAASEGTADKPDIRKHRQETVQLCLSDVEGSEYVSECLAKRLESTETATVIRTLDLLDHLMRKVPYFYRYIANKRFFVIFGALIDPVVTSKAFVEPCFTPKAKRRDFVHSNDVATKMLFLIRAWAEEFEPVVGPPPALDGAANFIIEQFELRALQLNFPEVPPGKLPYVYFVHRPR